MKLHLLEGTRAEGYTTFGCMWRQGECTKETEYLCRRQAADGTGREEIPLQSRVTAYWPDGSVKWTAHTADAARLGQDIEVLPGKPGSVGGMECVETEEEILLRAGAVTVPVCVGSLP